MVGGINLSYEVRGGKILVGRTTRASLVKRFGVKGEQQTVFLRGHQLDRSIAILIRQARFAGMCCISRYPVVPLTM